MRPVLIGTDVCEKTRKRPYAFAYMDYVKLLAAAGLPAVLVPPQPQAGLAALLDGAAGLVIPGGDDIPFPNPLPEETPLHPLRFQTDSILVKGALERKLPILGICYGSQLVNHLLGGTLHRHLKNAAHHKGGTRHGLVPVGGEGQKLLGESWEEASHHHQGLDRLALGLKPLVHADDGLIEGYRHASLPVMGFQWHVEKQASGADRRILEEFSLWCDAARSTVC
ncbi:MAG: gamma-glutamyl-gamma-aminobutyrate hydrolase family protein [Planctomycetota bacterium]